MSPAIFRAAPSPSAALLADSHTRVVDVVCLQECPPLDEYQWPDAWHSVLAGDIAIVSRYPVDTIEAFHLKHSGSSCPPVIALYAVVDLPGRPVHVCCVHPSSPGPAFSELLDRQTLIHPSQIGTVTEAIENRRLESQQLVAWLADFPPADVVAGDFNMPHG